MIGILVAPFGRDTRTAFLIHPTKISRQTTNPTREEELSFYFLYLKNYLESYKFAGVTETFMRTRAELADAAKWSKSDIELFTPTVELRRLIHDYSKDDHEFAQYMDSLKTSVLSAFYTPSPVVDAIADSLKARGVEIRKFLEPSAGQGAFVDSFLHFYPGTETLAFLQRCSS